MKRPFDDILDKLTETINYYDFFVDFKKVFNNVDNIEYKLNTLNYLLGKDNFDDEFRLTYNNNPSVVSVLPILLAIRDNNIKVLDKVIKEYSFNNIMDVEYYLNFIYKTNLIELFKDKRIRNLIDYVTGVEVGLDTNARKNRSGSEMENLVEDYLKDIPNIKYIKEATFNDIKRIFNISINLDNNEISKNKRFDFVVKAVNNKIYLIETNYYKSSGSKLNETSRSYSKLSNDITKLELVEFIWITDGQGWNSTKNNFKYAYNSIKHLYTIYDLNNDVLNKVFNS